MPVADVLTRTLEAAGLPVQGVSIGDPANKATWRVDLAPGASAGQIASAAATVTAFSMTDPAVIAREKAEAAKSLDDKKLQALAIAVHKRFKALIPGDTTTANQWRQALRDEFDAL